MSKFKNKAFKTYNNSALHEAIIKKLEELGYEKSAWDYSLLNFIEVDRNSDIIPLERQHSFDEETEFASLDELFAAKKSVETITIGGRNYSKEEVENRLKDLEEVN